ncbi:uncharacterized protein LOC143579529 [Bidens hawaiensis]|uniref:uncharacterized protein LOC143579529 n=1 Tax=Bidens hawaiensis TaxID=980011 RepID=UPI00404ABC0B
MLQYCNDWGILHEFSAPYTPQQNGKQWRQLVILSTECFSVKKFGKTCFELLNRQKPNLKWLEPYGSTCTVLDLNGKFGPKSVEGFFVGYASPLRRVYIPSLHKIVQLQNFICQRYTPTIQRPEDSRLFDYESLWEKNLVFDDDGESDEEIIESISPSTIATEVCENNLQSEVSVPTEVMPSTLSYHPEDNIIGDLNAGVEPKTYKETLTEESWVNAMQGELLQFEKLGVWKLVDLPEDKKQINTKWVFNCKTDENGIVVRNKARLVVLGFNQREGIDYNEVYAPVERLEAIWIFLLFASWKGFKVYKLDVKSAFLNGKISEEVYVGQPPGFVNPIHKDKVYTSTISSLGRKTMFCACSLKK